MIEVQIRSRAYSKQYYLDHADKIKDQTRQYRLDKFSNVEVQ